MRPLIGITGNYSEPDCLLSRAYYEAVVEAGGTPVIIPPVASAEVVEATAERLDGLLLSGGADMNPLLVGEEPVPALHAINAERDAAEWQLIEAVLHRHVPLLGICRGIQMLAAVMGGHVCQDIPSPTIKHSQDAPRWAATHTIRVEKESQLGRLLPAETAVNSFHHQAVDDPGPRLRAVAWAKDGTIEAVESAEGESIIGVQWHPEAAPPSPQRGEGAEAACMPSPLWGDGGAAVFRWLVGEAASYAAARRVHAYIRCLDSHCDTPMQWGTEPERFLTETPWRVDLPKMRWGGLAEAILVAYLPQGPRDEASLLAANGRAHELLTQIESVAQRMAGGAWSAGFPARDPSAIVRHATSGANLTTHSARVAGWKPALHAGACGTQAESLPPQSSQAEGLRPQLLLGIENGYAIGRDLTQIEAFRRRGVVYMTLCHNGDNDLCDSAVRSRREHGGLSDLGREAIREMNRVGMLVDMSHASEESFYQALEASSAPIACSHASCRALCDHPRNLSDDQMRALAQAGGVMQVTFYGGFLRQDGQATIADAVAHINHARSIMGIDHIGIGSDFDGDGGVPGLSDASYMICLTRRLIAEGYTLDDLRLLWGDNFRRLITPIR